MVREYAALPSGPVVDDAMAGLLDAARREFRDSDAAGDVLDWLTERAALSGVSVGWRLPTRQELESSLDLSRSAASEDGLNDDLLPCPFCGGGGSLDEDAGAWAVACTVCGIEQRWYTGGKTDAITAWNTRRLAASGQADKLQAFKDYTHQRLDAMGVPVDPDSPHKAAGCRIGGRLDWIEQRLAASRQGVEWVASDADIAAWLERHDLERAIRGTDARCAFEDARSAHKVAVPTQEKARQ